MHGENIDTFPSCLTQDSKPERGPAQGREKFQRQHDTSGQRFGYDDTTPPGLLDALPHPLYWKDRTLIYRGYNRRFAEMFAGNSQVKIIGKSNFNVPWFSAETAKIISSYEHQALGNGDTLTYSIETALSYSGQLICLQAFVSPLRKTHGEIVGVLGTLQDVTEYERI